MSNLTDLEERRERLLAAGHEAGKRAFQTYGITRLDKMVEAIVFTVDEMVRREFAEVVREEFAEALGASGNAHV